MPLPAPLSRKHAAEHKNRFGHVLIVAGSTRLLGAAALTGLAAMRSGAGLVTLAVPKSLNATLQKKISSVLMTWPLSETPAGTFSLSAWRQIKTKISSYDAIAIGPGLSQHSSTRKLVYKLIQSSPCPLIVDADGLNAVAQDPQVLLKCPSPLILTPHPGEMSRLMKKNKATIEQNRQQVARQFAQKYKCVLLLKGPRTVIASADGQISINRTGNVGLATAGSGDVLTGMITAFVGQGIEVYEAAKWGAFIHGKAGDLAAKVLTPAAMLATDIIEYIPNAFKQSQRRRS